MGKIKDGVWEEMNRKAFAGPEWVNAGETNDRTKKGAMNLLDVMKDWPKLDEKDIDDLLEDVGMMRKGQVDVPELPNYLFDFVKVILHKDSVNKHGANNWIQADGNSCEKKAMYASIFRHVASAYAGTKLNDSGLDHRLHAASRLLMDYTRDMLGLKHPKDE